MPAIVIAISPANPERRPDALPSLIRCVSDRHAMGTAALLALSASGRMAIAVIGSNGEYSWQVSPFSSPQPAAMKGAA